MGSDRWKERKCGHWVGELTQKVNTCTALTEGLGLIPRAMSGGP